jgi:hypothetical protein
VFNKKGYFTPSVKIAFQKRAWAQPKHLSILFINYKKNYVLYIKGTLFLIVVIIVFRYSFLQFKSKHLSKSLLSILLGGTMLRLWGLSDTFLHAWDERYHALVAKNFISNPFMPVLYKTPLLPYDYHQWVINHIWLHKQPLTLWSAILAIKKYCHFKVNYCRRD